MKGPFLISSNLFLFIFFPLWVKTISPILNSCSLLFLSYFCLLISKFLVEFLNASPLSLFRIILFSIIPLRTISIIFPYSKWFGTNSVTLCLVLLYSSTLSSAIFVQFLFFPNWFYIWSCLLMFDLPSRLVLPALIDCWGDY